VIDIPDWDIIAQCGSLTSVDPPNIKMQKTGAEEVAIAQILARF